MSIYIYYVRLYIYIMLIYVYIYYVHIYIYNVHIYIYYLCINIYICVCVCLYHIYIYTRVCTPLAMNNEAAKMWCFAGYLRLVWICTGDDKWFQAPEPKKEDAEWELLATTEKSPTIEVLYGATGKSSIIWWFSSKPYLITFRQFVT